MRAPKTVNPKVLRIVETIRENPGIYKRRLMELHPDIENMREVLSSARKDHGLIENRGSNTQSCWFVVGAPLVVTPKDRIKKALEIATDFGQVDESRHKAWVIDQIVRALTGCSEDKIDELNRNLTASPEYLEWIEDYSQDDEGVSYRWDTGLAP